MNHNVRALAEQMVVNHEAHAGQIALGQVQPLTDAQHAAIAAMLAAFGADVANAAGFALLGDERPVLLRRLGRGGLCEVVTL